MFYTDRLMLRTIEPDADLNLWVQWLNDVEYLGAIMLSPPVPSSKASAKKFLEGMVDRDNKFPCLVICERPAPGNHPSTLSQNDDYFTDSGRTRYPPIGLLNIGPVGNFSPASRVVQFGIALDREHQGAWKLISLGTSTSFGLTSQRSGIWNRSPELGQRVHFQDPRNAQSRVERRRRQRESAPRV